MPSAPVLTYIKCVLNHWSTFVYLHYRLVRLHLLGRSDRSSSAFALPNPASISAFGCLFESYVSVLGPTGGVVALQNPHEEACNSSSMVAIPSLSVMILLCFLYERFLHLMESVVYTIPAFFFTFVIHVFNSYVILRCLDIPVNKSNAL